MTIDGLRYFHVDGWMQTSKHGCNGTFARCIRRTESASVAREMGGAKLLWADMDAGKRDLTPRELGDWEAYKDDVLAKGLLAKFQQHPGLARKLLGTGRARLVFDDADAHWGRGRDGRGRNAMGRALEAVRATLQSSTFVTSVG
jgi:predicted NAD-dependent protein-ADP-ribosyltransferase YbiA (DUF1768 family)